MYEGDGAVTEEICYALTKPAITAVTVKAIPSPELVAQYNSDNETDMKEFPVANVTLGNGRFAYCGCWKERIRNYQHNSFS